MKRLVEFDLENGGTITVEVEEAETAGGAVRAGRRGEDVAEKAQQTFEQALETITPAAESVMAKILGLNNPPDEVTVEFGLKLSAKAGAFIASVGGEANYNITLAWRQQRKVAG